MPSEAARSARLARLDGWKAELDAVVRDARKDYAGPALEIVDALYSQFLHLPPVGQDGASQADLDRAWTRSSPGSNAVPITSSRPSGW